MFLETQKFLQGAYRFEGDRFDSPVSFDNKVVYMAPPDKLARPFYFRAGNSSPEMTR